MLGALSPSSYRWDCLHCSSSCTSALCAFQTISVFSMEAWTDFPRYFFQSSGFFVCFYQPALVAGEGKKWGAMFQSLLIEIKFCLSINNWYGLKIINYCSKRKGNPLELICSLQCKISHLTTSNCLLLPSSAQTPKSQYALSSCFQSLIPSSSSPSSRDWSKNLLISLQSSLSTWLSLTLVSSLHLSSIPPF